MNLTEAISFSLQALHANRLRTFLTTLGVIIGNASVILVVTISLASKDLILDLIRGVGFSLMIATALHAIATGNLLPAWVKVACVDISPATVTKLMDRGSTQTVGIVSDAEPFLRALVTELEKAAP